MNNLKINNLTASKIAILLIASTFAAACDSAAPPRSIDASSAPAVAAQRTPKPIPGRDQKAIESASNVQITKLDGGTFKLSDYRGKVLLVDFWATYCPPCVKQIPRLADLSRKYRDQGLEVIGLTADPESDKQEVVKFLKDARADYTIGYDNRWLASAFLKATEDETGDPPIPQLFVISREGRVVEHLIGERPGGIDHIEKVVNQQLAPR